MIRCPPASICLVQTEGMTAQSQQSSASTNIWFQVLDSKPISTTCLISIWIGLFFHCHHVVKDQAFSCGHQSMCIRCIFKSIFGQLWHHASTDSADMLMNFHSVLTVSNFREAFCSLSFWLGDYFQTKNLKSVEYSFSENVALNWFTEWVIKLCTIWNINFTLSLPSVLTCLCVLKFSSFGCFFNFIPLQVKQLFDLSL